MPVGSGANLKREAVVHARTDQELRQPKSLANRGTRSNSIAQAPGPGGRVNQMKRLLNGDSILSRDVLAVGGKRLQVEPWPMRDEPNGRWRLGCVECAERIAGPFRPNSELQTAWPTIARTAGPNAFDRWAGDGRVARRVRRERPASTSAERMDTTRPDPDGCHRQPARRLRRIAFRLVFPANRQLTVRYLID